MRECDVKRLRRLRESGSHHPKGERGNLRMARIPEEKAGYGVRGKKTSTCVGGKPIPGNGQRAKGGKRLIETGRRESWKDAENAPSTQENKGNMGVNSFGLHRILRISKVEELKG